MKIALLETLNPLNHLNNVLKMILSFSDETVQGTLEMGRNRMELRNENCYHEKKKKKKRKQDSRRQ